MSESLRDQLTAAFDQHVEAAPAEPAPPADPVVQDDAPVAETAAPAEAPKAADDRPRDEQGKFLPKDAAAGPGKSPSTPPTAKGAATAPAAAAAPAPAKLPRPSSWKKELEAHWDTLPPEVQAYTLEREKQYATGVSTYKTEADRAKHIIGALQEFEPTLQKHNIDPAKWITNLGRAHYSLSMGDPQQKIGMMARLIQDYGIDAQALFQHLSNPQAAAQQPAAPQQPQLTQADLDARIQRTLEQRLAQEKVNSAYEAFTQEVSAGKYPHFEQVKETMGRLLETGFAKDYSSAYDIALRMPQHADLAPAALQPSSQQQEATRQEAERQKVQRARSQAVSVRSSTPSAMTTQSSGPKGLREQLSEAYDRAAGGSRV